MDNEGKDIFSIICIIIALSMLIHFNINKHQINSNKNYKDNYKKYDYNIKKDKIIKDYIDSLDKEELNNLKAAAEVMKDKLDINIIDELPVEDKDIILKKSKN